MFVMIRLFHNHARGIGWFGLFFGLVLHRLVDGVALASSLLAAAGHGAWLGLAELGTFLAVALHKPLDAFAITSVMSKQHWSGAAQRTANLCFFARRSNRRVGFRVVAMWQLS